MIFIGLSSNWTWWFLVLKGRNFFVVLIVICHFKISLSQSHLTLFVVMLKLKLKTWSWKNCILPTLSRLVAKELFTLILEFLQILNLETIKNHLPTASFNKIDNYTNSTQNLYFDCDLPQPRQEIIWRGSHESSACVLSVEWRWK